MKVFGKKFIISLLIVATFSLTLTGCVKKKPAGTISFLACWNALSYLKPDSQTDNPVGNVIKDKTGTILDMQWIQGTEAENLNRIFSIGKNMPDVIMAPYWGGGDASSRLIRQAAADELIIPLDKYIENSKNLKDAYTVGVSPDFQKYELTAEEFGGKKFIIPMHTPATLEDTQNWGYTVYGRQDILNSLNVKPSDITSSQDVLELARKIKAGNFKDINGNPIIPASTWQNGWSYECYLNSFRTHGFTNVREVNNEPVWVTDPSINNDALQEEVIFMQNFVKGEELFDLTAFKQTDIAANQKHVTGAVGLTAAHYPHINNTLKNTLYKTNPEMRYVPLGPILDADGGARMPGTVREDGEYGFAVVMITKDCKNPQAVIDYFDYINSPEGRNLAYLGIEGEDWKYVTENGKQVPKMTDAFYAAEEKNPNYRYKRGIDSIYTLGVSRIPWNTFDYAWNKEGNDPYYQAVKDMYPVEIRTGTRVSSFDDDYPNIVQLRARLSALDYKTQLEAAYVQSSRNGAISKLNDYRNKLDDKNVISNYLAWLKTQLDGKDNLLF